MNNEYLHTNPGQRSKFYLGAQDGPGIAERRELAPVRVKCALCPNWAGYATTTREMRSVYAAHAERRHK